MMRVLVGEIDVTGDFHFNAISFADMKTFTLLHFEKVDMVHAECSLKS